MKSITLVDVNVSRGGASFDFEGPLCTVFVSLSFLSFCSFLPLCQSPRQIFAEGLPFGSHIRPYRGMELVRQRADTVLGQLLHCIVICGVSDAMLSAYLE